MHYGSTLASSIAVMEPNGERNMISVEESLAVHAKQTDCWFQHTVSVWKHLINFWLYYLFISI